MYDHSMYDRIRDEIDTELERRERAFERTENYLIQEINRLKTENEELKLELIRLSGHDGI